MKKGEIMAANIKKMIDNLQQFYHFQNKVLIAVGAGGGQFIDFWKRSSRVVAVDQDQYALQQLENALAEQELLDRVQLIQDDFYDVETSGDVVLFDFCLHEMKNAASAIEHARSLAPEVVIFDHWPDSEWAYMVAEEEKVKSSTAAVMAVHVRRYRVYHDEQHFNNYSELYNKVSSQGTIAIDRIRRFEGMENIIIPMSYAILLL